MSITANAVAKPKPCDINHLLQSLAGNRIAARKLAQLFLDTYPSKIALMDAAIQERDWVVFRRSVHDLRGSCALFSATACLTLSSKLEDTLPEHVDLELTEECTRFKTALADVAAELHLFLDDPN